MSAPGAPGPWLIHATHRWIVPAEDAFKEPADALPICQLRDPDERLTEDQTLANGFLLAAAPELFEALERADALIENLWKAVPWGDTFGLDIAALNEVPPAMKRALAKARGGH